ncbi:MAG TPA: hypothetical protein DCP31_16125, partial [Cyanobacteria bacterium UBA8543]|nr:hypothetical protein [Cyanobacteria bacterium UBA8543]
DDIEELSKAIAAWCNQEEHSAHLNALRQVRQSPSNTTLEQVSSTNNDTNTLDYSLNKQALWNALKQNT